MIRNAIEQRMTNQAMENVEKVAPPVKKITYPEQQLPAVPRKEAEPTSPEFQQTPEKSVKQEPEPQVIQSQRT